MVEHVDVVIKEVEKLREASVITNIFTQYVYPTRLWLIRTIKSGDCVDFTSLNQNYPKNYLPLPKIAQLVYSTLGIACMSVIDTTKVITR